MNQDFKAQVRTGKHQYEFKQPGGAKKTRLQNATDLQQIILYALVERCGGACVALCALIALPMLDEPHGTKKRTAHNDPRKRLNN
jgi:hypothetical protein